MTTTRTPSSFDAHGGPDGEVAGTDPRAAASIGLAPVTVPPGEVVHATLSVTNLRQAPSSFALSLTGLEPGWYGLPERVGPIEAGCRVEVPFTIHLPRGYPPCALLVSVEARPLFTGPATPGARKALPGRPVAAAGGRDDEGRRLPARGDLEVLVGDGATVVARLDPADVTGGRRGRFALVLRNRGAHSQQVRLHAIAPDPHLAMRFEPAAPVLLPGREVQVAGRVRSRRPVFGEPQRRPFAVQVQGRGTPIVAEGSFTAHPLLPRWASKTIVIGLVMALWAAVAVVGIKALSTHLHNSALQHASLNHSGSGHKGTPTTTAPGTSAGATSSGSSGSSPSSSGSSSSSSSSGSSSGSSGSSSSAASPSTPTVEVTGKVSGSSPGGVTVTLSPTSLVSPQVLGATGSSSGTLASDLGGVRVGGASQSSGPRLTSALRHRRSGAGSAPAPMLVRASHRPARLPDGKVYGTQAAAAFFPALVAAITPDLTTKTAPDGSFVFTGVPAPGTYLVSFTEPGYNTRKYVVQTAQGANVTLDTALSPGTGSLSGTVKGPRGPLGGVSITVTDGSVTVTTVTPTTGSGVGNWSVSGLNTPDTYTVTATLPGYGTQITTASLAASASLAGVDLTMAPGVGSISGTVTDGTSGQPLGDVTVTATDGTATATATTSTVAPVGTYMLPNLAIPGTWTLTISGRGWITQTQLVKLTANTTVNASLTTSGANVVGVVSTKGTGLANVGLSLSNQKETFKTLSESVSPVGGFDFGQIPPGQYVLSATSFGYTTQSASVTVTPGQTKTVDLTMPYVGQSKVNTGSITGTVLDEFSRKPIATVPIELDGKSSGKTTNAKGVYTITSVAPGLHEVTAEGAKAGYANAGVQVSVAEGATVTAPIISLPGLAKLSGVVLSAATGLPIPTPTVVLLEGTTSLGTPTTYTSTSTGTYTITDVPAGNYVLKVGPKSGTKTYDVSEKSVSVGPDETLIENVNLTEGPTFEAKTYFETSSGTLTPQGGVCVIVSRLTGATRKTTTAKLSTSSGGPVQFPTLIAGDTYVATFKLPTTALAKTATCLSLTTFRASAATDQFVAKPDNTAIYPAVLALPHAGVSVALEFPYVTAGSGGSGHGITTDCPIEATTTALPNSCPHVVAAYQTATLPSVSITGTTGYASQTNGTPGSPDTATVKLIPPSAGTSTWTYPTTSGVPTFVSTQVTLLVTDKAGQFETQKKTISLGAKATTLDELLTAVPVPVSGTITPATGVAVAVNPNVLSPTTSTGVANNLTSTDDIGATEGTAGTLKWSDPATGASGGAAQPGSYSLTLTETGYVSASATLAVPLCPANSHCGITVPRATLTLRSQVTLVVTPAAASVQKTLTLPTVTLSLGANTVAQKPLAKSGSTYSATFTNALTPTASGTYSFAISGPGIQTYTSGPLTLPSTRTLTETPTLTDDGWVTGTVTGILVPSNPTNPGAKEALSTATVVATSGTCTTASHPVTLTTTTTHGGFRLVGATGGLLATTPYQLCVEKDGFQPYAATLKGPAGKAYSAATAKQTVTVTITATQLDQRIEVEGVSTGVVVTVTATSPIGKTITCTFKVGTTTAKTCTTASAAATGTGTAPPTLFTFTIYPTTYSFTVSAPLYEGTTIGPIPYAPGETPLIKSYTLTQQQVEVKGTVTVSATGRRSTNAISGLPLTLTASTGKTHTTTTSSTGTYSFLNLPVGSYTITVGDTYTTLEPISFTTGTTSQFVENFSVYAPPIPLKVTVTSGVSAAPPNGETVTLTPSATVGTTATACGSTHTLLEKGLGSAETTTAVGTGSTAVASFSSLVPDVYTVTFSAVGSTTDKVTLSSHTLVVCPSTASSPATSPTPATFTLGVGEIAATVTLSTVPSSIPKVTMSATNGATLKTSCTPVKGSATTATCTLDLLVDLTSTYTVTISASGYKTSGPHTLKATTAQPLQTLTAALSRLAQTVRVTVGPATGDAAVTAAKDSAKVTFAWVTHPSTTRSATASNGVATVATVVTTRTYTVSVKPSLTGASTQTFPTLAVTTSTTADSVTLKTGTVTGTITLTTATTSHTVTVTVAVGSYSCGTATIAKTKTTVTYSCVLPLGTYTLTFTPSQTSYTTTTKMAVKVASASATTLNVTIT